MEAVLVLLLQVILISVHVISCILFSEGRVNIFIAKVISAVLQCDRNLNVCCLHRCTQNFSLGGEGDPEAVYIICV
jgi:hypothetical protein